MPKALAAALVACLGASAHAAPKSELWEMWAAHDESSERTVDHGAWDGFLKEHVVASASGVNLVGYAAVPDAGKAALKGYISMLEGAPVLSLSRGEQLAYWINMYNAKTVDLILDNLPVDSIRDIGGLFAGGPWDDKAVTVEGVDLTLNDIEHRILRPIWNDARIHYAVNCASIGCPNLATDAFTADNAERLLEEGAREYVNHPRGARVEGGALYVSSIYEWFKEDFGGTDAGVIEHLSVYAGDELGAGLSGVGAIAGDGYDWDLNAAR